MIIFVAYCEKISAISLRSLPDYVGCVPGKLPQFHCSRRRIVGGAFLTSPYTRSPPAVPARRCSGHFLSGPSSARSSRGGVLTIHGFSLWWPLAPAHCRVCSLPRLPLVTPDASGSNASSFAAVASSAPSTGSTPAVLMVMAGTAPTTTRVFDVPHICVGMHNLASKPESVTGRRCVNNY